MLGPGDFSKMFGGDPGKGIRQRKEARWKMDVWKALADIYGEPRSLLDALSEDVDDADDIIRQSCSSEEMSRIYLHKANVTLQDLLFRPLDNPAFKALESIKTDWWRSGAGVVFPVPNNGAWILHTLGHPAGSINGKSVIVIYAKALDRDIMAETLTQFIESRKGKNG